MSVVVHLTNIFLYFDNFLNPDKAKKPHSFCIARSIRYIAALIKGHSDSYRCNCFKCLACKFLISVMLSSGHKKLLYIVNSKNFMFVTNEYVYDCLQNKNGSYLKYN